MVTPRLVEGHGFHQHTIWVLDGKRDEVQQHFKEAGISTMVYYPVPQDRLPVYEGEYGLFEWSEQVAREVLSLPIWPEIEGSLMVTLVDELKQVLAKV